MGLRVGGSKSKIFNESMKYCKSRISKGVRYGAMVGIFPNSTIQKNDEKIVLSFNLIEMYHK